ncbi:MAG TPA: SRPBCC family protein [Acidimicrobiales bacterium]|nr:SRPBCC family protein [Acidimicrobiales bacterium]
MELTNEFTVDVPVEEAWEVLTDVERIAPCMPGAQLQEVDGDEFRGLVKVKVGPINAEYRGKATFLERDEQARRAVLRAEGREARGQGNATATVTATLEPAGTGTRVSVLTELTITGRVAQFGRGVLADITAKLLGQFVTSLEATVLTGGAPAAAAPQAGAVGAVPAGEAGSPAAANGRAGGPPAPATGPSEAGAGAGAGDGNGTGTGAGIAATGPVVGKAAGSVDLLKVAGPAVAKRAAPLLGAVTVVSVVWVVARRRRRR